MSSIIQRRIFATLDDDGDGQITFEELRAALQRGSKGLSGSQISSLLKQMDKDGDAQISYEEFAVVYKQYKAAADSVSPELASFLGAEGGGGQSVGELAKNLEGAIKLPGMAVPPMGANPMGAPEGGHA